MENDFIAVSICGNHFTFNPSCFETALQGSENCQENGHLWITNYLPNFSCGLSDLSYCISCTVLINLLS